MSDNSKNFGLTRRDFVKTVGLAGLAVGAGAAPSLAAAEPPSTPAPAMPKRKLGKTGAEVSILSLGCMFDTINNQLLLTQALKYGVTHWDTAESYGEGLSEEGLGRFFTRNPGARKDIFLVTKLQPKGGNYTARLDQCLKRLKTDYVDLFFVHAISDISDVTPALRDWGAEMKKAGKIKLFGFSTHTNMENCLAAAAKLDYIDAVMFTYNYRLMATPKMQAAVNACAQAGIGLIAMKTQGGGPVKTGSEAELKLGGRFLEKGFTDKQAKLKAVWENPQIASICSQMPNITILKANVAAALDRTRLAGDEVEALRHYAQETCGDYCAGCASICQGAVGGLVPVADIMRGLMYHREYGEPGWAREILHGLPGDLRQRLAEVDYAPAEAVCPQGLAIGRLMAEARELLG